jgi:hypothetical protein
LFASLARGLRPHFGQPIQAAPCGLDGTSNSRVKPIPCRADRVRILPCNTPSAAHLYLNATVGSTRIAQRPGMKQANKATPASKNTTVKNVSASVLVTPSNKLLRKRVSTNDNYQSHDDPDQHQSHPLAKH